MALNKLMHHRNPYRERKPNFKELADKFEKFRQHVSVDDRGVHIDFKNPECLRALTWALLKDDFGLDVRLPADRLIPTVPLRLNYILWLEDILNKQDDVKGIDIGAGASCIYGLLSARKNSWNILATEADATNCEYAKKNVADNNLGHKISVLKVSEGTILYDVLSDSEVSYDFCMCNPPFFGSNFEAWGMLTSRSDDRPEPSSVNTASPAESIVAGGEVDFVKRIIADSVVLKDTIRVYTTMLGKKSSVSVIKEDLKRNGVKNIGQTEFYQGKTMRWGIGWSFDDKVQFPKPPSKVYKADKPRPPLVYSIPCHSTAMTGAEYTLKGVSDKIMGFLEQLQFQIKRQTKKCNAKERQFELTAVNNTWSNQRRKRRQQKKTDEKVPNHHSDQAQIDPSSVSPLPAAGVEQDVKVTTGTIPENNTECSPGDNIIPEVASDSSTRKLEDIDKSQTRTDTDERVTKSPKLHVDDDISNAKVASISPPQESTKVLASTEAAPESSSEKKDDDILLKCVLRLKVVSKESITLEMQWLQGSNREYMHQVMQYIKNKLC